MNDKAQKKLDILIDCLFVGVSTPQTMVFDCCLPKEKPTDRDEIHKLVNAALDKAVLM
jgi:hypothetical protein